jgi:hypothetical protein
MIDIEVYGVSLDASKSTTTAAEIMAALKHATPIAKLIRVTRVSSQTTNLDGQYTPFLRIVMSPAGVPHLKEILERLEPLNLPIQVMALVSFIPKPG